MKIVQVLTYVSTDGAYGGPVAVARFQCEQLARLGHHVVLHAGWDGQATLEIPGVEVRLHRTWRVPGVGLAGIVAPGLWMAVRRDAADADVVHFHYARDLVQLPAASLTGGRAPVVCQAHGMIRPDRRRVARILDWLFVRPTYRRARLHLVLTEAEQEELPKVARSDVPSHRTRNGVSLGPEVARAPKADERPRILYLARLHARKRPLAFVEAASVLKERGIDLEFRLYGPDSGELGRIEALILARGLQNQVSYRGAVRPDDVRRTLAEGHIYVLPSVDEPFPMSLLEAMSVGLPSIITDKTGLSRELAGRGSAVVTSGDSLEIAGAIERLLDERAWSEAACSARADIAEHFSPMAIAADLESLYLAISGSGEKPRDESPTETDCQTKQDPA